MTLHHADSGEVVDLAPLGSGIREAYTAALVKTDSFEAIRLVLRARESLPAHRVSGRFILHCLEGRVELNLPDKTLSLAAHQWIFFDAGVTHGLRALEPSSLLLTILLPA